MVPAAAAATTSVAAGVVRRAGGPRRRCPLLPCPVYLTVRTAASRAAVSRGREPGRCQGTRPRPSSKKGDGRGGEAGLVRHWVKGRVARGVRPRQRGSRWWGTGGCFKARPRGRVRGGNGRGSLRPRPLPSPPPCAHILWSMVARGDAGVGGLFRSAQPRVRTVATAAMVLAAPHGRRRPRRSPSHSRTGGRRCVARRGAASPLGGGGGGKHAAGAHPRGTERTRMCVASPAAATAGAHHPTGARRGVRPPLSAPDHRACGPRSSRGARDTPRPRGGPTQAGGGRRRRPSQRRRRRRWTTQGRSFPRAGPGGHVGGVHGAPNGGLGRGSRRGGML